MVINGTRSVFLMSVLPVTFGPIWHWFLTARQQILHGLAPARCLPTPALKQRNISQYYFSLTLRFCRLFRIYLLSRQSNLRVNCSKHYAIFRIFPHL